MHPARWHQLNISHTMNIHAAGEPPGLAIFQSNSSSAAAKLNFIQDKGSI